MNAIFKVLWNKARGQFVATDETKTAFGKGKVRSTVQKGLSALLLSALAAGSVSAAGVVSGWDSTTVTADQAGKVLNVTTSKYVNDGKTGINKFSQFTVNADQIANLQFGSGQQLLNLVNAKIEIDGVVNAVKNNKIGGDLYFVSPVGMVVGTTGVINAGSLTTTITTQDQFNTWSNLANGDQPTTFNDAFLQNLRTGDGVPINPAGVITVKGSINAGNSLALLAGSVQITSGASLTTGVANFQDLVNIRGADGQVTTSANLEKDLAFETDPDTGDVLLFARAAGDLAADAETQAPESGEKTDGKGTAVAASVVVEEGAVVKAAGNLTAKAYAGNGAVNPLAGAPILFKSSDGEGRDVSASVELLGTVHAEGNLTAEARAFNIVDHSTSFIGKALETIQSGFVPIDTGTIEYVDMSADARVTVGEKAEVTGVQGLTLESEAHSDLKVGNQSGFKNFLNWGKAESIPVVSAAAMRVKNTSAVEIKGALATDGELKLAAAGDLKVDASVKAATSATKAPQASFIYADLDAGTNVSVADGASIGAAGTSALGPSKVTVEAKQTNRVETDAETNTPPTGNIALAVNITKFNASAQTNIGAGFTTSGTADVRATNKTETLKVRAKTTVGDYGIQMKIMDFGSNLAFGKVADSLAGVFGTSAGGSATTSKFQLGGAAAYVKNAQSATVTIEPNVKLESTGKFTVEAKSDLADHHYEAVTKQVIDNEQGNAEKDKQGALAILINETGDGASSLASVTVGDGASITTRSSGDLTLSSEALINKDRFKFLKQELIDCFNAYADHFTADAYKDELAAFTAAKYKMVEAFDAVGQAENFTTGITQLQTAFEEFSRTLKDLMSLVGEGAGTASDFIDFGMSVLDFLNPASYTNAFVSAGGKTYKAQADNPFSVAGSLAVLDQTTKSAVEVGAGAALESAEALGLTATSRNESIAMGGQLDNFLGVPLPNIDKGKSLGASVVYHELGTDNLILVKEGAALSGTKTDLNANDELDGVTIAASAGYNTGTLSASGMAAVTEADAKNRIAIDDEARIEARSDDLTIKALRDDSVQTVAGALSFVKSVDGAANAVGAGVAVNLGSFGNTLEMKDLDGTSSIGDYGAGALKAGGTLALTAESGLSLNAVGLAGQAGVSGSGSANTKKPDAAGDLGALGTQTGSSALTGAASGLAEGGALQGAVSSGAGLAAAQAGGDAAGADGSYSGLETGNPSSALSGIASAGSVTSGIEAAGSSFQLSAAGSFAWNDVTESNVLHIEGASADQNGMITLDAQKTAVESVTNKWVGAFAGGAAVSVSKGGSGTSVGIGGAAAVNQNNAENRLTIKNVSLSEKVENMGVYSLVNGTTVAQGLGVAVSTSGGPAGAIDAGVSVNLIENTVRADVEGLSVGNESGEFEYAQTAWTGEIQVTGGTTVGVASGSGGFSGAVGAAVAVADIDNTVASTLKGANFTNAKSVDVKALASLTQVNTAVGVQAAVGSGSGAALNGSIISADITNIVNASAEDSQASLAKDGSFTITARDAEEAHAYAERAKGRTGFVEEDELLNRSLLKGVQIAEDDSGENYRDLSSGFMDGSGMTQVSAAISVAATGGSSGGAGGAGVVVTDFENTFGASSKGLTVTHDGSGLFSEKAQSDVVTVAVAAGAAGTSGNFSASGSVIVSDVTQTAQASAEDLTLTAGAMKDDAVRAVLAAQTNAKTVNVAGNVSVQVSAGGGGLGAAVVVAEVENNALTTLKNSTISSVKDASAEDGSTVPGALGLLAENNSEIWTAAAAATISSNAALGASVAVNRAVGNAQIDVDAVTLDGLGHFDAQARDDSELWTLSGAVSAAVKPGAAAGAGLAFASSRGSTKADVNGLTLLASEEKTDIGVSAEAQDHVSTLTLAVGAGGSVGLSGAAAKNVVERTVAADLTGLKTNNKANEADETIEGAGDVVVRAESRADIDNLALVAAGSQAAALGAGVAVNTIDVDVAAGAHDLKAGVSSLNVAAHSANDIDTIGVGGAGAGTIAAAGSTAFNTITGDTSAALTDSILQAADAVAVHAESDDVIGTYAGQGVGAGTIALGLSVAMSERSGATTATVSGSSVKETGTGTGTLTMKSGVADANINNAIVEQDALNIQTSLEDKRAEETVDGIAVSATSATTYKTLTINGGGGGSAQAAGTASIVTHAGKTEAGVSQSTLESAGKLAVEAGDYANFSSVLVTAGGAGGISANGSVTQTDAAHATRAAVENSSLTSAAATTLSAEAKEGVSNLTIAAGGAGAIAVDAVVAIANQKSSVVTALENSTVAGGAYTQKADYLGRITNLGVSAAGAGALAGAATVAINTADVVVKSVVDGGSAVKPAGAVSIEAGRTLDWNEYGGAAAASGAGAVAGTVYINETAGETLVVVDDAQLGDGTNQVTLSAKNDDSIELVAVSAAGAKYVAAGATVAVNTMAGNVGTMVKNAALKGTDVKVEALADRKAKSTLVSASASLAAGLAANVFSTRVGGTGSYAELLGEGDAGTSATLEKFKGDYGALSKKELTTGAAGGASEGEVKAETEAKSDLVKGTGVMSVNSTFEGSNSVTLAAKEDAKAGSGIDAELGLGTAGAVGIGASVVTVDRVMGASVTMSGGGINAKTAEITASAGADDSLKVHQGSAGLVGGNASYVREQVSGGVTAVVENQANVKGESVHITAKNDSSVTADAFGVAAGAVAVGAQIAKIKDASSVVVKLENSNFVGDVKATVDRAQRLQAEATAGYGGAVAGAGAVTEISDSGKAQATLTNVSASGASFETAVNLHPELSVKSYAAGGALGVSAGVVQATAEESGEATLVVTGGELKSDEVKLSALAGEKTDKESDALRLTGRVEGYGGAAVAGLNFNTVNLSNTAKASLSVDGTAFRAAEEKIAGTAAQLRTGGYGLYDASADAVAAGGILAAGSNDLTVVHGLESEMTLKGSATTLGSLDAAVENAESAKILGESAGGALINADGNDAVRTTHEDISSAALTVAGSFTTAGDMSFEAASNSDLLMTADNTKGGLAALSGAVGTNTMEGSTAVRVTDGAALSAGGDLRLGALNAWTLGAASGDHLVKSEVYGAIAGGGIKFTNTVERSADVSVGKNASLFAGDSITAEAKSTGDADVRVLARTAGAFNALGATVESSVKNANTVSVESGAVLRTQSTEGVVALAATGEDQLEHEALTRIEGSALANANSNAKVTVERTNTVSLKSGAEIRSGGEVLLNAGAAADGTQSKLEMQNRAESFSYAFLSGISADLNAKTKLSGIVDVAGKVVSTTNTAVTGDSGDYMITGDSLSHYWGQLKADDKSTLAVKGSGKKDAAVEETGRINVTGSIDAGVNTKADIVISGLLNPEGSDAEIAGSQNKPTVKVEAGTEEAKESILSSISGPVSESEGNVYWERYAELEKILREYTGATTEAIVGYQAEFEALAALMEQKGLGEWVTLEFTEDGKTVTQRTFVPIEKSEELYVAVNGITVSGGSIKLNAAEVTGSGAISANAAEGVWIKNESNASLKVGDIVIQAKGGEIELNGVAADESALKEAGFQGNVRSSDNTADPVISIESEAQTGSYTVKYKEDEPGNPLTVTPSTNLVLTGEIRNNAGDVSIWAKDGDLVSLGDVGASGTLTLTAKGSIMQSYTSGLTNIGGDVPGNAWQNEIGQISSKDNYDSSKDPSTTSVSSNAQAPSGGKWVAGGAIIISGDLINLNGTVQSGYDTYELKINETVLEAKISEIREAWRRAGSPTNIDVKSSAYQLQAEKAVETNDGSYKLLVAAWYDPVKDRIVMDDVLPEGGSIFITGKIASTGGGKIFASDGSADVRFNAGNHDVLTGRIDTGSSKGVVQFTDLFWSDSKKDGTGAKVTRWQDGKTTEYMVDHNGQAIGEKTVRNGIQNYSPKDGLLYVWTEGTVSGSTETQYYEYMAKWWGGADDKLKDAFETEKTTVTKSGDLYQGATITDQLTRPNKGGDQDANFYAWMDVLAQTDTGYQVTKKKWKTGFLGCHKWTSYTITRDTTSKRMVTYTVKADKDVSVGFLKGSNTVDITSNRSIHLGNSITAQGGTISLNAGGDIRAESAGASLNGADTINLTAKGDIGSSLRPIALKGGSGELKLGAEAANIHIDGTNLGAGRSVSSDGLLAGSTLSVAVRGDLQAAKAQGKDVTLSSVEGGVKVNDLRQLEAAGTHAVNISALNDVEVTASTGDLGLGLIESKSGDVVLTVENGSVYDASGAADASDVSDEKRLEAWKRAGLINADGSSTGDKLWEADVEAEKNRITQAYARMESYKAFKEKGGELTDAQEQDYTDLQAIYGEFASAEAAVSAMEQDENSSLGKLVASRENYGWTENDLLYSIADTIINSEGSSTTTARATNVRGKNVEINAANAGSVGEVGETVTGRLSDEDETKRLALLKALSRADIGDFSSKDGVVSVTLKIPVTIEASGNLTVNARDNIFLESPEDSGLAVKEIVSKTGDVRVTSRGGISAAEGSGLVSGNTVTLRGGTGGIGAADAYLKIHSDPAKWAAVNAGGDIFIEAVDANGALGDMTLYSLAGDQDVSLKANNLYAYSGDKLGDDYDDFAELGYIQGQTLNFEVRGDFGTEDTALRVGTSSTVNFSESVGNVRLRGMGESGELAINGINASGVVDIDSEGGLKVGAVKGDSVELDALKQITLTGNLESTGEHKDLAVTSKEAGIELADNSTVRSKGGVKLDAKAGELKFTGGVVEAAGDASLLGKSVTATQGNLSAGGRIEIGATGGGIDAAGLQTQAGAGTLITAVGGGVALSGGSSIEAAGDVKISSEETLDLANATVKSTAGKVELDGLAGIVAKEATLLAAKEVTVTAKENVEVSNSTVEAASLAITAAKNLTGTELKGKITGAAELTAGENLVLDSADLSGGTVNAVAAQGLSAHGAALNATEGTLTLTAEADDIDASSAKLTAKDELTLTAQQSITATEASVEAASLAMTAETGSVEASGFTATVTGQASVEAGDSVTLDGSKLGAGALTASTKSGDLSLKSAEVDISGAAELTAKQSITATEASVEAASFAMTAETGSVEASGFTATVTGQASVEAGDSVTLDGSKLGLGALTASAKSGDLSLKSAEIEVSGAAELTAQQSITAVDAKVTSDSLTMTAEMGKLDGSRLTATVADQASIEAGNSVKLDGSKLGLGAFTATANSGDLSLKSAELEVSGAAELTAQESVTATDANVTSNSLAMTAKTGSVGATGFTATVTGQASVEAGNSVTLDGSKLGLGAFTATANSGDLSLKSAELEVSSAAELTAQESITATDANLTSNTLTIMANTGTVEASGFMATVAEEASIVAGDAVVLDNAELTAGALTATATTGVLSVKDAEIKVTKGGATLMAETADIDASRATLAAKDKVQLTAKRSITATDASVEAASLAMTAETGSVEASRLTATVADQASVEAGDSVTLDNAELTAGALTATAKKGNLSVKDAEIKATKGGVTLTAEAADIDASSAKLTAKDELTLTAQQSITAADASVEAASLAMTANTGSVEASRLTATVADQASVEAGDAVVLNNADLTAGALTATATSGDLSVKAAEINATKGGVTLTAKAVDIDASGVNLTAVGPAKLTAGQNLKLTPSGDAVASVTAKSLSATAGGALDASRLQVKVNEASAFRSNGLLTLTDANVSGGSLRAEGDAGVEGSRITVDVTGNGYNEGDRGDYEGVVTIKSSKGPITLTGADVKADKGDFFARSEGDLNVETAGFKIQDGGLGFKSTGGNLTLAGATGLKGDFLEMEAHGSIGMEDMELSVEEILRISAGGDINSRNLQLEITEDENGVGGKAYFEATTGTVHLEGSTITAKTSDGFIGDMTVIAGKDARLDDVFTPEKNVKAESMSIRAGDAVNFGEGTVALETKKDLTVEANHLTGDRIAAESVFAAGSALSISVKEDLHVEEGVQVSGKNVKFSSKDFTLADRTTVRGGSTAEIDASGEVAFTGDVLVTADDSVGIGAASGGITFTGAVTVGDETKSENKAKVTLHAAGSILQREVSGNAGVRGSSLEAQSSGGFVKLDAREGGTSGEGGNAFTKAEIESAGDVVFGSTGRTTELAVNASKNGAVSGDLRVQGERGAVIFTNGVSASGEVAVNAAAVQGSDLSADGRLAIVTALEKNAPKGAPQGVVFSGGLSGSIVTVYAGSGDVVIEGPVRSTLGEVDVYRLDQTERGVVRVGEADSAHTLVVFNARGDVVAGPMHSADTLYAFAGWEGRVYGRSGFTSDVHKAGAVEHAEPIGLVPDLSEWLNLDAAELDPSALPRLSFTARNLEYADTDRIGPWRFLLEDLTTPLGSWLFLRLRPDAAEDDQADEALLEGFPARKDGVIRDLRESTKEDFGWIMTSL
ncbi:leukotoxin LktA family filamentous adhesin [Sutterella wadsworthensis]|uniref:leukotoxin LktA family filamentous adhesin n=2 Tax=Sutterella wadsworthensis TaxID=40545 RepID=UPI003AAF3162